MVTKKNKKKQYIEKGYIIGVYKYMQTQNLYKGCVFHQKISVSSKFEYGSVLSYNKVQFHVKSDF